LDIFLRIFSLLPAPAFRSRFFDLGLPFFFVHAILEKLKKWFLLDQLIVSHIVIGIDFPTEITNHFVWELLGRCLVNDSLLRVTQWLR
jgi:hypothetical protein